MKVISRSDTKLLALGFHSMQQAVDSVLSSPHPVNKVAACVYGDAFSVTKTNHWPDPIAKAFPPEERFGDSSGTVHAETQALMDVAKTCQQKTEAAYVCVTDPFCPNCAKNMALAGIRTVFVDHKGFEKDFAQRRADAFTHFSLAIAKQAGMGVYKLYRRDEKLEILIPPRPAVTGYAPNLSALPRRLTTAETGLGFELALRDARQQHKGRNFALCLAKAPHSGEIFSLTSRASLPPGFSEGIFFHRIIYPV